MSKILKVMVIMLFLIPLVITVKATTWDVSGGGDLQSTIDLCSSGDTILIHNGTYDRAYIVTKHNLTIIGDNKSNTIISAKEDDRASIYVELCNDIKISNLTLSGYLSIADGIYFRDTNNCSISNSILRDSFRGVLIYTESFNGYNNTVKDCDIYDNEIGVSLYGTNYNYTLTHNLITNCSIHHNNYGINITGRFDWKGYINDTIISNCDINDNSRYGLRINQSNGSISLTSIYSNYFMNNHINAEDNTSSSWYDFNYWSDYLKPDSNKDGIGDTPYSISSLLKDFNPIGKFRVPPTSPPPSNPNPPVIPPPVIPNETQPTINYTSEIQKYYLLRLFPTFHPNIVVRCTICNAVMDFWEWFFNNHTHFATSSYECYLVRIGSTWQTLLKLIRTESS
jgi:hypothetical protein